MKNLFIFIGILFANSFISCLINPLIVDTKNGEIEGIYDNDTGVRTFLGIPYAVAPVGELRFKYAEPVESWTPYIKSTKQYGAKCYQFDHVKKPSETEDFKNQSEDCLFLNIWAPDYITKDELLPVMVWIHGGDYRFGSGSENYYNGAKLSKEGKVIVVNMNYRVGLFGFIVSDLLKVEDPKSPYSGNYGLVDQNLALRWIKENIKSFGGDPEFITIFGESAGAFSVCYHLLMPMSKGLFNRAIMESGTCAFPLYNPEDNYSNLIGLKLSQETWKLETQKLMAEFDCYDINCLRSLTPTQVTDYTFKIKLPSSATVDGFIIPDDPLKLFQQGRFHNVEVISGTNRDEGASFFLYELTETQYNKQIVEWFPYHSEIIKGMYSIEKYGSAKNAISNIFTDFIFVCPARRFLRFITDQGNNNAYQYQFTQVPSFFDEKRKKMMGSYHGVEIFYIFYKDLEHPWNYKKQPFTTEESKLANDMIEMWTNFARSGNPNLTNSSLIQPFKKNSNPYIKLNTEFPYKIKYDLKEENCDFHDEITPIVNNINLGIESLLNYFQ